jgi:hypothetical protein
MNRVIWIERGWQPVAIGFVPSAAAWQREMDQIGRHDEYPSNQYNGGHTTMILDTHTGEARIYVIVSEAAERDAMEVISTIVHEAVHVWQFLCEHIGERKPGLEMEAYGIQHIVEKLIDAYCKTQGKGKKWL